MFLDELPPMEELLRKVGTAAGKKPAKSPKKAAPPLPDPDKGDQQPNPPERPEQPKQQAAARGQQQSASPWQHPAAQQHFGAYGDMLKATNDAWREEMNSRVAQNQAGAERQHEQQLAAIKAQAQQQQMQTDRAQAQEQSQARIQKNNAIMGLMGYPAKTINGQRYGAFEAFSGSLLGR